MVTWWAMMGERLESGMERLADHRLRRRRARAPLRGLASRYATTALVRSVRLDSRPCDGSGDLDRPDTSRRSPARPTSCCTSRRRPANRHSRHAHRQSDRGACEARRSLPRSVVYLSTSGVYGDCGGEWSTRRDRSRRRRDRARRRVDAEQHARRVGRAPRSRDVILRVPGIYAADRLPLERLRSRHAGAARGGRRLHQSRPRRRSRRDRGRARSSRMRRPASTTPPTTAS